MSVDDFIASRRVVLYADGPAIRRAREGRGLSLRDAAKRLKISPTYLSRLETSKEVAIASDLLDRVFKLLGKDEP